MSCSGFRHGRAAIMSCLTGLLLVLPTAASAEKYPSPQAARGFDGGLAGWTSSSTTEGTCLAPVLCASAENSFQPSGGADDGGYIRSAYTGVVGAMALAGTTTAVWRSPSFTYSPGDGDSGPLSFSLDRRASVDQLLSVSGNSAEYSVQLVDVSSGGETFQLIPPATLAGARSWTEVSRPVDPGELVAGAEYRILITSRYTSGTTVLATGSADYDNVALVTAGDGTGGPGGKGKGAGKGDGVLDSDRLQALLRETASGAAVLSNNGKRLFVRVACPRKAGHTCRTTAQGLLRRGRPATSKRTIRLRSGKTKRIMLFVKPKARSKVSQRKRLLVKQRVRAGKATATVFKSRKLIRR